jgi:hypothetical protein
MGADVRPIDRLYVNVQKLGAIGQGIAFNQLYTGDGTATAFTLPASVPSARDLMVSVEGLLQIPAVDYSVSTTTLTFTTGVTSGNLVDARYLALGPSGAAGAAGATGPSGAAGSSSDLTASGFALNTNLVATGAIVDDISGNLITTGQTLQTQITSNDSDISTLTSNLAATGQTLTTDINTVSSNLITTGQTLTSEISTVSGLITSNDSDISTLTTNLIATGQTLQDTGHLADTTTLESFAQGLNVGTSSNLANRKLHVVGDVEISGTIYQSGSVFEGGGGGGGGGSSTFIGLTDTPGSFTAGKYLSVNSAGNAVEMVNPIQSGFSTIDQGYFTGFSLAGAATGIVQNASGSVAGLDLADNKWDVSIVEESDSQAITGDANWSSVKLLLPVNGTNNATTTTDSSSNAHTVTLSNGAKISTTQSKWGGSSLFLDGSNDYGEVAYDADFDFGNADFTVELWYYPLAQQSDSYIIAVNDNSSQSAWAQAVIEGVSVGSGMKIEGGSYDSSAKWTAYSSEIALNTWHHLAYVRYNNKVYMYVNGTATDSGTTIGSLRNNSTSVLIGKRSAGTNTNAYLDDIRITKGLARYTANFTPPTEAFGTVINTVDTKYISQIGGWDDTDVDYGIKKISNSELSIKKMGADDSSRPIDRLYVNVQKLGAVGQGVGFNQIFTGDGTTTNYLLSDSVPNTQDLLVSVEGLIQTPNIDYTLAGNTGVSFTTGVTSGNEISLRYLALGPSGAAGAGGAVSSATNRFTGNGVISGFEMTRSVSTADEIFVYVNGLFQDSGDNFTITNGTGLYFTSGDIASGDKVIVRHIY